ncbi:hypothetical protein C5167_026591 [Papaver somniferum]|uniref:uncharacterized protein LOC113326345 n=1 Tax=Papaver somniferum TaxID=3469 RepID=UPI000E6F9FAD|nr:uncharacterized protein LOC113326345 [Papaver somniferum]RZC85915.1 hypothetical protein C5167_026591 [Papaver somniferum]
MDDDQDFNYKKPADTCKQTVRNSLISNEASSSASNSSVGLRILIHNHSTSPQESKNTVLVKHTFKLSLLASTYSQESSFLRSCCLCKKKLSPEKNVYMYMGDQGFCSVDCRSRQIVKDEIREIEISTKKILSSSPCCPKNVRIHLPSHRNRIPVAA